MYRPTSFSQLPLVVKNLLIINILFFIGQQTELSEYLMQYLALWSVGSGQFNVYQLITYGFLHGNLSHLIFNMIPLFMFGRVLENTWGSKRFLNYYLLTVIGAGIVQLILGGFSVTIGASGAVFGLLAGFGILFPNTQLFLLFPPIPIKAKYFVIGYCLIELFLGGIAIQGDTIAHFAHLGGAIMGFLIIKYWQKNNTQFY
jgi:membrane associated rhomboid family serine protease